MAVAPPKAPPRVAPPDLIRVDGAEYLPLVTETEEAAVIAADTEIGIPILFGAIILLGLLYSAKYFIVPLLKLVKVPGSNWFADAINDLLGVITDPIRRFFQWVMHKIAEGIDAHSRPIARWMEAAAHEVHDFSIVVADTFAATATALARMRTEVIPREVRKATLPLRRRIIALETVRKQLDAIARRYGYANFPTLIRTATPHIKQLVAADLYVRTQGHVSLAGALSVYEASAKSWNKTQAEVRKLGYYTIPDFIRHTDTQIQKVIKPELQRQKLAIGKINKLLSLNKLGIPVLLAAMAPAAVAAFFRPAIPRVCTEVGECAATNLLGKGPWNFFKDLLKLLLAASLDALLLADLCLIAKGAQALAQAVEGPLRELVVVEGGLIGIGCASNPSVLPPPAY